MTTRNYSCVCLLGLLSFFATPLVGTAGVIVNENSTWPASPILETFEPTDTNVESERDARFNRDLTQTFQVASAFQLSKIFIDYEEGVVGKEITIHLFPVDDVFASGEAVTPSGPDLLGGGAGLVHTTTAGINTGEGGNNPFAVLEFDLTAADEVMLAASAGAAGYAFQIERTGAGSDVDDGAERAFKWHYNNDDDLFAGGRSAAVGGGPDDAGDDFLMALAAVPEPSALILGVFAAGGAALTARRRIA